MLCQSKGRPGARRLHPANLCWLSGLHALERNLLEHSSVQEASLPCMRRRIMKAWHQQTSNEHTITMKTDTPVKDMCPIICTDVS